MSYYVLKRMLAGLQTTPDLLDRKMGLFMSMQRAKMWAKSVSGVWYVEMLARGDNLQAIVTDYSSDFEAALMEAYDDMGTADTDKVGIYMALQADIGGHAVCFCCDRSNDNLTFTCFDPNNGYYVTGHDGTREFLDDCINGMVIHHAGAVVIYGVPRDLRFLTTD
jgi:hypothetical protein